MATITQILTALDVGGSGGPCALPVDAELYPPACLRAAADAFADVCTVEFRDTAAGPELVWSARTPDDAEGVLGEFLNYALQSSLRMRQERP
jgi:hypothetical protein